MCRIQTRRVSVLVLHQTGVFALSVLNFREHFAFCVKRASRGRAARGAVPGRRATRGAAGRDIQSVAVSLQVFTKSSHVYDEYFTNSDEIEVFFTKSCVANASVAECPQA